MENAMINFLVGEEAKYNSAKIKTRKTCSGLKPIRIYERNK
jgi:hypothetical protein